MLVVLVVRGTSVEVASMTQSGRFTASAFKSGAPPSATARAVLLCESLIILAPKGSSAAIIGPCIQVAAHMD